MAISIAILVNRAVLLEIIKPAPGLMKPIVEEPLVEAEPIIWNTLTKYVTRHN